MRTPPALFTLASCLLNLGGVYAQSFKADVTPLIESSCIYCHDADTETGLNLESIGHELSDADTFRQWEKVFDRVHDGEMPPESEDRPERTQLKLALASLERDLRVASLERRARVGRVPARRLTKLEFGYTLRDLLFIDSDVTSSIPDEVESGSFDTVGASQRISAVHMASYLKAADEALDHAINLGRNPYSRHELDFVNSTFLNELHDKPLNLGGSVSRKLDDGVALFRDVDYLITSFAGGFHVASPGIYRITSKVSAYQTTKPITLKMIRKDSNGSAELLTTHDLAPNEMETIVVSAWLQPGDNADLIGRAQLLMHLVPLIMHTDSTRVVSVMIQDHFVVPKVEGVTGNHHNLSHHGQDQSKIEQLQRIETEIIECFGSLLTQMKSKTETGSTLLDNTSILFGSNLGNANAHHARNLPIFLAGGGFNHGRYVVHNEGTPLCNLFVTMLNTMGIGIESFGQSTGALNV